MPEGLQETTDCAVATEDCTWMVMIPAPVASRGAPTVEFTSFAFPERLGHECLRGQCGGERWIVTSCSKQQWVGPSVFRRGTAILSTGTDRQWRLSSQIRSSTIPKFYHTVWKERLANLLAYFVRTRPRAGLVCTYIEKKGWFTVC